MNIRYFMTFDGGKVNQKFYLKNFSFIHIIYFFHFQNKNHHFKVR